MGEISRVHLPLNIRCTICNWTLFKNHWYVISSMFAWFVFVLYYFLSLYFWNKWVTQANLHLCRVYVNILKDDSDLFFKKKKEIGVFISFYILSIILLHSRLEFFELFHTLVHGSYLEQRIFAGTKLLGRYQVQSSRFMAKVIVLVIIDAIISNDWKIWLMEES